MTKRSLPAHIYQKPKGLYFQRRGWPTVRIEHAPGTAEFALEYAAILNGAKLTPRTARDYDKVLGWVKAALGGLPVDGIQRKDIIRARDANAETIRFANYIVQVVRILLEHAIDLGWRSDNPGKGVTLLKADTDPRQPWPSEKIEAFRARSSGRTRLIFELCLGTGQRIGDVLKMRWSDIDGDGIKVRQSKTGIAIWVPFTASLRDVLAETPKIGVTLCAWGRGKPTSYRGAADMVMAVRRGIGAEAFDIHSLRYSAAAELAAAGCSDDLIAAVTGHSSAAMVKKYAGAARQKVRAIEAQGRRK